MFSSHVYAEIEETLSSEKVLVAEKIRFELSWKKDEIQDIKIPEPGMHFSEGVPDLPWYEIIYSEKKDTKLVLEFAFYLTGEYPIPVAWTETNGKKGVSQKKILVESVIPENDSGPADIIPPLTFSGSYLGRLLVFFILVFLIFAFGVYAYRLYSKQRFPLDAIIQAEPMLQRMEIYEIRIDELLKKDPIPAREFARALSGYIREKSADLSGRKTSSLTEAELFRFLYDQFPFEEKELQTWKRFLTEKKFRPGEDVLTKKDAEEKFLYWKGVWDQK